MAVAAALDLDTMYVVSTRSRQIVRNLPCPEWDELQLRQVVWRSIPLAIVTFFLQVHQSVEIPCCQMAASLSVAGAEMFNRPIHSRARRCDWSDAHNWPGPWMNGTTHLNLTGVLGSQYTYPEIYGEKALTVVRESSILDVEKSMWKSCNCEASTWSVHTVGSRGSLYGRAEDILLPYLNVKIEDGKMGFPGSGNLLALNFMLQDQLRAGVVGDTKIQTDVMKLLQKIGRNMRKEEKKGSFWKGHAVSVLGGMKVSSDWSGTVGMLFDKARAKVLDRKKNGYDKDLSLCPAFSEYRSVRQTRPGKWLELVAASCLLLNAAVPIVKRVARERSLTTKSNVFVVAIHIIFDLLLYTSAMLMAAGGLMVHPLAVVTDAGLDFFLQSVKELLQKASNAQTWPEISRQMSAHLKSPAWLDGVEQVSKQISEKVVPGIALGGATVLKLLAGVATFWLLSALLARQTVPKHLKLSLHSSLSIGPCGPFILFAQLPGESLAKLSGFVEQQLVVRELLLLLLPLLPWMYMDGGDVRVALATLLSRLIEPVAVCAVWGVAVFLHAVSGFAAVAAVRKSHKTAQQALVASEQKPDIERTPHSADEVHLQPEPLAEKRRLSVTGPYGSFLAPPRPDLPNRKSIRKSRV
ncbi:yciC [Symbiodinium necroappetens]|uniref:YciC protein n=1 Tax=Symbiodinium necroappetens TaxID=1628268 RepID=A0A813CCF2_9DINO|nr:yciC [Symbiodinium necroappetens]